MSTLVICPNCNTQFEPTAAIAQSVREELSKEFNQKWKEKQAERDEQVRQKEAGLLKQQADLARTLEEEKKRMEAEMRKDLQQKVGADYEAKLRMLEDANKDNQAKLDAARQKEMDFLKKMQELKDKEKELELETQRRLMEERARIEESVKKAEEEKSRLNMSELEMKLKERDKQLEDQKRLVEEMRRKAEQGSMQLQGEVQELALEELLRSNFPFDVVNEVGKGKRGADCILTVRNNFGQECGRIIFESKRTKDFGKDWTEKLKADMRVQSIELGVIVTQAMPDGIDGFGQKDDVWICTFADVTNLVHILRELLIRVYNASKSNENKGDKMTMLYSYLISNEFAQQWNAIREGFTAMRMSIQRERDQMEKLWKAREKQLEKVLLNAAHIRGSIEGISGMDVDLNLTEGPDTYLIE
ncbi:MAG: DUF2130 domain-containing protein [Chitinophagaceae bacterium]|nr:DUF2130 domain-containing protein [Chitinophagaceae bacterium]